jgi:hypothetical protein
VTGRHGEIVQEIAVKRDAVGKLLVGLTMLLSAAVQADDQEAPPVRRFPHGQERQLPLVPAQAGEPVQGREASWPQQGAAGRLSPEERRQLRRDINEHGRDIYGQRRPPR